MSHRRRSVGLALSALFLLHWAPSIAAAPPPPLPASAADDGIYRLATGDKLRITVYNEASLTGEYAISSTGKVAFPLIGDVPVGNRTIEEVQLDLRSRLANGYVNDPRVNVEVLEYRPYYVLGEVAKPGEYPYSVGLKIVQAVAKAGGYTYRANSTKVFLRRTGDAAERRVDLRRQNLSVLPGDTIRIGERYF